MWTFLLSFCIFQQTTTFIIPVNSCAGSPYRFGFPLPSMSRRVWCLTSSVGVCLSFTGFGILPPRWGWQPSYCFHADQPLCTADAWSHFHLWGTQASEGSCLAYAVHWSHTWLHPAHHISAPLSASQNGGQVALVGTPWQGFDFWRMHFLNSVCDHSQLGSGLYLVCSLSSSMWPGLILSTTTACKSSSIPSSHLWIFLVGYASLASSRLCLQGALLHLCMTPKWSTSAAQRRGWSLRVKLLMLWLVFASPVQSGFLPPKQETMDRNRSRTDPDIVGTEPDHLGPVFFGPWNWFRLVQTSFFV